jgi:hypothetical protein
MVKEWRTGTDAEYVRPIDAGCRRRLRRANLRHAGFRGDKQFVRQEQQRQRCPSQPIKARILHLGKEFAHRQFNRSIERMF